MAVRTWLLSLGAAVPLLLLAGSWLPRQAAAQGGTREPFQQLLLVPPDDKDYVVVRIPAGSTAVVTDLIAYNVADGRGRKVPTTAESYLWLGGYSEGKSLGLVNRMRLLGNATESWHLHTGLQLAGAPELLVSNEKGIPGATSVLVYVTGYLQK